MLQTCICGFGKFRRPEIHEQAGAGQGYLCDAACAAAQIDELLGDKMPFSHQPADHAEIDRPVAASLPHGPWPCQWPHKNASISQAPKPSTASIIWLWKESRRISPSVTMSSPAASWRETASSTALSSMDLNLA